MKDYKDYKPRRRLGKKPSGKKLKPGSVKAGLAIAVVLATLFAAKYSYGKLLKTSYFGIKEIIVTGEKRVHRDDIIGLSGIKPGDNILAVDLNEIGRRIESQPWIKEATTRRVLPRSLAIEVKERSPFAILKAKSLYYIDREGTPFKELDAKDNANYPVIAGIDMDEIDEDGPARDALMKTLDFVETDAGDWPEELAVSEIRVSKDRGITVFSGSAEVKVGLGEYKVKIGRLKKVLADLQARGMTAGFIDLTYTGQVVVR